MSAKKSTSTSSVYLTKQILVRAATAGVKEAAKRTMDIMGYNVIAHNGWVVKKYADGTMEKISRY